nr:hypothetical protein [Candidatus Sigynarchaeota archaeon]
METPRAEMIRKREQALKDALQLFEAGSYNECIDNLKIAYDISVQMKDKDVQKFVRARMDEVDAKRKSVFIEKLTSTFKKEQQKQQSQEETVEGLVSTVSTVISGFFSLEDRSLQTFKVQGDKLARMEESFTSNESKLDGLAKQAADIAVAVKELKESVSKLPGYQKALVAQMMAATPRPEEPTPPPAGIPQQGLLPGTLPPGVVPGAGPPSNASGPADQGTPDKQTISDIEKSLGKRRKFLEE